MLNFERVERLREMLCDRFTAEELVELLCLTTEQVFDRFTDECLELRLEDV
jgi:hypothetical protein